MQVTTLQNTCQELTSRFAVCLELNDSNPGSIMNFAANTNGHIAEAFIMVLDV